MEMNAVAHRECVSMKGFPAVAKRVTTQLVDDIDGSVINDESGETIEFAVDGVEYVIDLERRTPPNFTGSSTTT
jgi:hypothetical protein